MSETPEALHKRLGSYLGKRIGPFTSWNPVNQAMVWQWCKAMGDNNPTYLNDGFAPPTALQMWTMRDVDGNYAAGSTDDLPYAILDALDEAGYAGVIATEYDQSYFRYLEQDDRVTHYSTIVDVSELKSTGLGEGFFVTELAEYFDANEAKFAEAKVTYFKYKMPEAQPGQKQDAEPGAPMKVERSRPVENYDSKHYWQGLRDGKILIQKCDDCGELRHPPSPMCPSCQSLNWGTIEASGKGTLYSYTAMHYPHIPPYDYPNIIGLIELEEGVRMVTQVTGIKPDALEIGMEMQGYIEEVEDGLCVALFKPANQ